MSWTKLRASEVREKDRIHFAIWNPQRVLEAWHDSVATCCEKSAFNARSFTHIHALFYSSLAPGEFYDMIPRTSTLCAKSEFLRNFTYEEGLRVAKNNKGDTSSANRRRWKGLRTSANIMVCLLRFLLPYLCRTIIPTGFTYCSTSCLSVYMADTHSA